MTGDEAVLLVLTEARRYIGVAETPRGSNRGVMIDYANAECGAPLGSPWCAAWISLVGRQALGAAWPCPRTASVAAVATWAESGGLLMPMPQLGDLVVLWNAALNRYAHIGLVAETLLTRNQITCYEGNTNPGGSREGWGVSIRDRLVTPQVRFVRWTAALASVGP